MANLFAWALGALCGLLVLAVAAERRKAHRRALGHERRLWFEYSLMAARSNEDLTGIRR